MAMVIDSSVWIDFTRLRSPKKLKLFIAPYILDSAACVIEPVMFEVLRHATAAELPQLLQQFQALPMLATPPAVWTAAANLGRACRQKNFIAGSLDLLIAAVSLHHGAELVTFDNDYLQIAAASTLRVKLLTKPAP